MKCKDCIYCEFEKSNGGPNMYYCVHPTAAQLVCAGARMICRTERGSMEFTIKSAPRWCPLNKQ